MSDIRPEAATAAVAFPRLFFPAIDSASATTYGLQYVGYDLSASAVLTFIGLIVSRETKMTCSRTGH